jgi:hypothetical protein
MFFAIPVPPPLVDVELLLPPQVLMRAPLEALIMLTFLTIMFSTISLTPAYWPSEPTEMPCEPWQYRFSIRTLVVLGLKETQSSPLTMWLLEITTLELR